jgi:hypothetical protein
MTIATEGGERMPADRLTGGVVGRCLAVPREFLQCFKARTYDGLRN